MNIPRHWREVAGVATRPDGRTIRLTGWGWSSRDPEEAVRHAQERVDRMIARVARGEALPDRYPYGVRALREEIIEEIASSANAPAVVTRNTYGSLVINAASVMFIDVDVPETGTLERIKALFGRQRRNSALDSLKAALTSASRSSFRLYRTAAGFRVMATERTFVPGSTEAEHIMAAVGADPAYVQLCRAQSSFRARVTPKPWRCGHRPPPNDYPRHGSAQEAFEDWLRRYEKKVAEKAVCAFLGEVGAGHIAVDVAPVLRYHDEQTRANQPLPLA